MGSLRMEELGLRSSRSEGTETCFRAIAFWIYGSQEHHSRVRQEVVRFVVSEWSEYEEWVHMHHASIHQRELHVDFMGSDREYGGLLELKAAANLYRRPIYVYDKSSR